MLFVSSPFATKVEFESWQAIDDLAERDAAVAIAWKDLLARQKRAAVPPWRHATLALAAKVGNGTKQLAATATAFASEWPEVIALVKQVRPPVIRTLKELSEGQRNDSLPAIAPLPKVTRELTIKEKRELSGDFPLSNTAPSPFQSIIDGTKKMADGTKEGLIKLGGGTKDLAIRMGDGTKDLALKVGLGDGTKDLALKVHGATNAAGFNSLVKAASEVL